MQTLLMESAVRAMLIAAVIALVLFIMRIKTASLLHAVWAGVVIVMLLLPMWLAWGPRASLPVLPSEIEPTAETAMPVVDVPATALVPKPSASAETRSAFNWATVPLVIYLVGLCALLLRLAIGTIRANRLTSASCVVPVTVGLLHPRIILPGNSRDWPQAQLAAVLAHEGEHIRRRDPLFQWIALLNRAIFWFHPLAWWLERQLSSLAEEVCDAAVITKGHDPRDYSKYLLDLARSVERTGTRVTVGMAMPGVALPHRIRQILSDVPVPRISRLRMACTLAVCTGVAAILAAGSLVRAQSNSKAEARPVFEVASVKPVDRATMRRNHEGKRLDGAIFVDRTELLQFIVRAYIRGGSCTMKVALGQDCPLIAEPLPEWIKTDRWEIQAKLPANSPASYTARQLQDNDTPQLNLMLQMLLEDRFHLKVQWETREIPVYALTVGKNGPKLKQTPPKGELLKIADGSLMEHHGLASMLRVPAPDGARRTRLSFQASTIQDAAEALGSYFDRPVMDRTGLSGEYDFAIEYDADLNEPGPAAVLNLFTGLSASALSAALQDVGLRLESTKAPVQVLVIDHVEKPSEN